MKQGSTETVVLAGFAEAEEALIADTLRANGYRIQVSAHLSEVMLTLQEEPPELLLIPWGAAGASVLDAVKHDRAFGHLPVMIVLDETTRASISWASAICDDYLIRPVNADELLARVALCIARSHRDVNANPLTGLPGNLTIMREAARRLESGDPFAMGYVDMDHFKAFNDKYGFERGDQVLRMAARVLVNAVHRLGIAGAYVGHVGGDDFILMVPSAHTTQACEAIIRDFDTIVRDFYDDEDREAGEIRSKDRQGNPQTFPLMSCSIAVVDTEASEIRHVGELSARAAEVKKEAKRIDGSTYMIDRRG